MGPITAFTDLSIGEDGQTEVECGGCGVEADEHVEEEQHHVALTGILEELAEQVHHRRGCPSELRYIYHYNDEIMGVMASQITSPTSVYSTVYSGVDQRKHNSGVDQRKHKSSVSLAFVWGSHRGPVNSPHKWPVTRKMFPFDDVIMMRSV